MTDRAALASGIATPRRGPRVGAVAILYGVFGLALVGGFCASPALRGSTETVDPQLVVLLRFMALMKFAGVLGAVALVHWRLTRLASWALAGLYVGAVGAMAVAPGLIWGLTAIAYAALSFHAGLLVFLVTAWKDDGATGHAVSLVRLLGSARRSTTMAMGTTAERHR